MCDTFRKELELLINGHSIDNYVGTNDFIVANSVWDHIETMKKVIYQHDVLRDNACTCEKCTGIETDKYYKDNNATT